MRDYYLASFRDDLAQFMASASTLYFGHAWSHTCADQLARVPAERRACFLVCLYFTVLVDQAMHAHAREQYPRFAALTRYPKFCHGLGQFQQNPRAILVSPVERGLVSPEGVRAILPAGMELFVEEVLAFFRDHMPEVDPRAFFERLVFDPDVQIPELLVLARPELRDDVAVVAYRELRRILDQGILARAG